MGAQVTRQTLADQRDGWGRVRTVAGLLLVCVLVASAGCTRLVRPSESSTVSSTSPASVDATAVARQYGLHVVRQLRSLDVTLPANINDGADWGRKQMSILNGGYDLLPFAGKRVTVTGYRLSETYHGEPADLWTVRRGSKIVGAYVTQDAANPANQLIPGVFGLKEFQADH